VSEPFDLVNPPELGTPRGFAHGMIAPAAGRLLFVAGQIGIDPPTGTPGGFMEQFDRALARVLIVVRAAGGRPEQIVRMTVYVTNMATYRNSRPPLRDVWQRHLGSHYPAMALVEVSGLFDARALVEIEATAVLP
jgi:enamine deaminase RidA (YjgF/YER057c/UK114 family)